MHACMHPDGSEPGSLFNPRKLDCRTVCRLSSSEVGCRACTARGACRDPLNSENKEAEHSQRIVWRLDRVCGYVQGVGGAHVKALNMNASRLPWLQLSGTMFDEVLCLAASASGGPDFSCYTQGAICAGLLRRCQTVFDYPHCRIAFLPSRVEPPHSGPQES